MLDQLYIAGTHEGDENDENDRGPFAVICSHSVDGNICDVYGETLEKAEKTATEIIERITRTFAEPEAVEIKPEPNPAPDPGRRPRLSLRYSTIEKPKADFLKHSITFQVSIPLTDETLQLRERFEHLAGERKNVTVEIVSAQLPMFGQPAPDSENNISEDASETTEPIVAESGATPEATETNAIEGWVLTEEAEPISDFTRDVLNSEQTATQYPEPEPVSDDPFTVGAYLHGKAKRSKAAERIASETRAVAERTKKNKRKKAKKRA